MAWAGRQRRRRVGAVAPLHQALDRAKGGEADAVGRGALDHRRLQPAEEAAPEAVLGVDRTRRVNKAAVALRAGGARVVEHLRRDRLVGRLRERRLAQPGAEAARRVRRRVVARLDAGAPRRRRQLLEGEKADRAPRAGEDDEWREAGVQPAHAARADGVRRAVQRRRENDGRVPRQRRRLLLQLELALNKFEREGDRNFDPADQRAGRHGVFAHASAFCLRSGGRVGGAVRWRNARGKASDPRTSSTAPSHLASSRAFTPRVAAPSPPPSPPRVHAPRDVYGDLPHD